MRTFVGGGTYGPAAYVGFFTIAPVGIVTLIGERDAAPVAVSILALAIAEHFDRKYPAANREQLINLSMVHPRAADIPEELRPAMFEYVVSKLRSK